MNAANPTSAASPIGVIDSGLGGLSVLKQLIAKHPNENYVYLGDTARLPYGNKSPMTILQYLEQNMEALKKHNIKALVVACNSASSILHHYKNSEFPVHGVIEPGASKAVSESQTQRIGVIGTRATVAAQTYVKAIKALSPTAEIFQQACPLLVPLAEEGWTEDPLTNLVIYRYLSPLLRQGIDTLVLGCTHYPALKMAIAKVTGPHVQQVDSALAIAELLENDYVTSKIARNPQTQNGEVRILTTDYNTGFEQMALSILEPDNITSISHVDLT